MKEIISRLKVRSVVVLSLVLVTLILAISDKNFRPVFGDLAKIGVGFTKTRLLGAWKLPSKKWDRLVLKIRNTSRYPKVEACPIFSRIVLPRLVLKIR